MPGANAAPPPAAGSRAVVDAQLLLFDLDAPPAAPGRVAAKPPRTPNRSAASGEILRTGGKTRR